MVKYVLWINATDAIHLYAQYIISARAEARWQLTNIYYGTYTWLVKNGVRIIFSIENEPYNALYPPSFIVLQHRTVIFPACTYLYIYMYIYAGAFETDV